MTSAQTIGSAWLASQTIVSEASVKPSNGSRCVREGLPDRAEIFSRNGTIEHRTDLELQRIPSFTRFRLAEAKSEHRLGHELNRRPKGHARRELSYVIAISDRPHDEEHEESSILDEGIRTEAKVNKATGLRNLAIEAGQGPTKEGQDR